MRALGVLGAVAALLAAYLLFFDHDPRGAGSAGEGARLLASFDPAALRRVTIARPGEAPFTLARGAGGPWRIEPGDQPADQAAVEDLAGALDQAESARVADVSPQAAGLAPARVMLTLDQGTRSTGLWLGRADATGRGVFVQNAVGGPVRVGPQRLLQLADRPATAFRDRRLVPFEPDQVARLSWRAGPDDREHRLERQAPGWRNAAGERVAEERVSAVLRSLGQLRGERDAGPAAGTPGWIEVRDRSGATARVTGGVSREAWDEVWRLLGGAEAADRRLLSAPPDRVHRVELQDGARRLALARPGAGSAWTLEGPAGHPPAEQAIVNDWLARLAHTEVTVPTAQGRRLTVDGGDAVTVGARDPAYALLDPDPARFRARSVLDFAHFDVRELRRISAQGTLDVTTHDGEIWASAPPGAAFDQAAVGRIVSALGNLRAEAFVSRPPPGRPDLVLEVQVQPPGEPTPVRHTVQLWASCVGQTDDAGAFRIPRAACDQLRADPTKH
ncbi:MAG TPA: DUF4340 domain-containing protein [Polyangia bacterium]|nr:DUF4340 domain-containing protein [Polyangia bacterium]